jgi:SAM-dependent methyltransferase
VAQQSVKEFYNKQYSLHRGSGTKCPNALHDLDKASRRVAGVVRAFGIPRIKGSRTLDVGAGLGFYTKALSLAGAEVLGVDFSEAAVEAARATFPDCRFECAAWPADIAAEPSYDLIWMVNFSLMNTFDVAFINEELVDQAMRRLRAGGVLVVGWNSNFSGRVVEGYSHWSFDVLAALQRCYGFSAPFVIESRSTAASWLFIRFARVIGRSIPFFMVKQK